MYEIWSRPTTGTFAVRSFFTQADRGFDEEKSDPVGGHPLYSSRRWEPGYGSIFLQDQKEPKNELVLYGNVDIRQVELAFNASERIAEIMVREGEPVKKGQLLAVLETVRLQHGVDRATSQVAAQRDEVAKLEAGTRVEEISRARAEVEAARAQADDLERTYRRLRPLAEKNLIAPEQIDQARAKADAAQAQQQAAVQELKLALAGPRKEDIAAARSQLKALEAERH